ncbi:tetratricopeptide repeat protein [Shewanella fidelis]|uniref:tetratricopeptide repeat protein n=1 Tax=Shewanella fidelis TaxID=173509 RepID=UPI000490EF9F|nr:tetratricopeptide repeat protein [Shewanella fidelis]
MQRIQKIALLLTLTGAFVSLNCHAQEWAAKQERALNRFESNLLNKASSLLERHDYRAALTIMQPLLEQATPHPTVFQYACKTIADTEAEAESLGCWQRGYKLYPNNDNIAINLAHAQLQFEQFEAAITSLAGVNLANVDQPIAAQVRYMRGYAYYQLAQYKAVLTELLRQDIKQVKPHWWPLISYSQLGLEQWQAAKASAEQWLTLEPVNRTAWQVLMRSELGLNQLVEAAVANDIAESLLVDNTGGAADSTGLLAQIKAYNLAASCSRLVNPKASHAEFSAANFACAQYTWLSGRYQQALDMLAAFDITSQNQLHDDFYLLQGQLFAGLKQGDKARLAWAKVGLQALPLGSAAQIKHARQHRNQLQGQALLLIGQSYWLDGLWPEAQASYRKLAQTPGFATIADAFNQRLSSLVLFDEKLR